MSGWWGPGAKLKNGLEFFGILEIIIAYEVDKEHII